MKLKVLGRYTNTARNIDVYPGDEIEVKDELAAWLMNDAPGCFENPAKPPDEQTAPGQESSDEARRQSTAILDEAQRLLADAHAEADHTRATALDTGAQKPFDMPPDGTTLKTDAAPSVITGPDSGVEVTHRAAA